MPLLYWRPCIELTVKADKGEAWRTVVVQVRACRPVWGCMHVCVEVLGAHDCANQPCYLA